MLKNLIATLVALAAMNIAWAQDTDGEVRKIDAELITRHLIRQRQTARR